MNDYASNHPIAIIGMGCRFPLADSLQEYWSLLTQGVDAIREVPSDRWDIHSYFANEPGTPGKMSTRFGGFLREVKKFDPTFFRISPKEAQQMDPQQRLLLEVTWEALESSGLDIQGLAGSDTSVFCGVSFHDYCETNVHFFNSNDAYSGTGNAFSIAANRISYCFDFHGPSEAIDTACSSSLVAIHHACQSLNNGESNLSVVGGVNLTLSPRVTIVFSQAKMMAPDGRCKTFDESANGYVRGEGCGVVVLKKLADALKDGDRILAVIRGSAINQDGKSNGLTAPNGLAQQQVIKKAWKNAGIQPQQVSYIEAHGTGTALGDPIEIGALNAVLGKKEIDAPVCHVSSVKTNIGHLEAAAGIAGLIKVVLSLQHQEVPPHLHFKKLNPHISLDQSRIEIPLSRVPWRSNERKRIAGISSFGFGGTNCHVVIEEGPVMDEDILKKNQTNSEPLLFPISARSPEALKAFANSFLDYFQTEDIPSFYDIAYTENVRRSHHDHRMSLAIRSKEEAIEKLNAFLAGEKRAGISFSDRRVSGMKPQLVFVFSGHGSQWLGMGRELMDREEVFRKSIEESDQIMRKYVDWSLLEELSTKKENTRLDQVEIIQPSIFAIQVAQFRLWQSLGIVPDAVVGHSMGEVAAAYVSGVLSLDDAARVICHRGKLLKRVSGKGGMVIVELTESEARESIKGYEDRISIAVCNGPKSIGISGDPEALKKVVELLEWREVFCRWVKTDVAFHCPQVDCLKKDLLEALEGIQPQPATIPIYSTVKGEKIEGPEMNPDYWVHNMRDTVLFSSTIQKLREKNHEIFLEISPHPILSIPIEQTLKEMKKEGSALYSTKREQEEKAVLLESLGTLYTLGYPIDFKKLYPQRGEVVSLPHYPWQRERYWLEDTVSSLKKNDAVKSLDSNHPLIGQHITSSIQPGVHFWEMEIRPENIPYLKDHRVEGAVVFPAAAYLEIALEGARELFEKKDFYLEEINFEKALVFSNHPLKIQLAVSSENLQKLKFQISSSHGANGAWTRHAVGMLSLHPNQSEQRQKFQLPEIQKRCTESVEKGNFYQAMKKKGLEYGGSFQGLEEIKRGDREALAKVKLPQNVSINQKYLVHPVLLDSCFQLLGATILKELELTDEPAVYLPIQLKSLKVIKEIPSELWCHAMLSTPHGSDSNLLEGDLLLLNHAGETIVEAKGLTAKKILVKGLAQSENPFKDWFYKVEWQKQNYPQTTSVAPSKFNPPGTWLIFADVGEVGKGVSNLLKKKGETCILIYSHQDYQRISDQEFRVNPSRLGDFEKLFKEIFGNGFPVCRGIIHLWSLNHANTGEITLSTLDAAQRDGALSVMHLVQGLTGLGLNESPPLWLVTRGAQAAENESISVHQSPLWGLAKTLAHEHPEFRTKKIDLGGSNRTEVTQTLFQELFSEDHEDQILLRPEGRYVARMAREEETAQQTLSIQREATYLITGGLGGLGLKVAQWLVEKGARHLVLVGRRGASSQTIKFTQELEKLGAKIKVAQVDVAQKDEVDRMLKEIDQTMPPLKGVLHAAGVLDDGVILQLNEERFWKVMDPKLKGGWNLHQSTLDKSLDFFVLFSSAASMLGSPGQANYSAANAFLDALAIYRRSQNLPALSIQWGAWDDVGLAAQQANRGSRLALSGFEKISPEAGVEILGQLLSSLTANVGVFPLNLEQFFKSYPKLSQQPFFSQLAISQTPQKLEHNFQEALVLAIEGNRQNLMEEYLCKQVAKVLRVAVSKIDSTQPLNSLGFDSLLAVEFRNIVEDELKVVIPVAKFFEDPSISQLAVDILRKMNLGDSNAVEEEAPRKFDLEADIVLDPSIR